MFSQVRFDETLGEFCGRHDISRGQLFRLNPHLSTQNRIFHLEGIPTAELLVGEQLRVKAAAETAPAKDPLDGIPQALRDRYNACIAAGGMFDPEHNICCSAETVQSGSKCFDPLAAKEKTEENKGPSLVTYGVIGAGVLIAGGLAIKLLLLAHRQRNWLMPTPRPRVLIQHIQACLSPDLLKPQFRGSHPQCGHCYVATEALFYLLGGASSGWKSFRARDEEGVTHWWLQRDDEILDPTSGQYLDMGRVPPYAIGRAGGFLTKEPSQRTVILLERVQARLRQQDSHWWSIIRLLKPFV